MNRLTLLLMPALLALGIGFLLPMGTVLWTSLHHAGVPSLAAWQEVLGSPVFLGILWRTLGMAVMVTLITLAMAYPLAYLAATRAARWAPLIMALVAVPYLTSILIRSYAWVAILGGNGLVNRALMSIGLIDYPLALVFNRFGTYVGSVHILLPMAVFPIYAAMQRIDPALMRAGASLGAPPGSSFATIFLPLSWPGVGAGAALVFLAAMGFYITPALLGAPGDYLVAQAIEVRISTLAEFDTAAAQACVLLLLVTVLMLLLRKRIVAVAAEEEVAPGPGRGRRTPAWLRKGLLAVSAVVAPVAGPLLWAYGVLLLVMLLAPMVVVVLIAFSSAPYLSFPPPGWSLRWFIAFFNDGRWVEATGFSLVVSIAGALTALAIGTPFAMAIARGRFAGRRLLWLLAVAPMILPHIALALGLFFTAVALGINGHIVSFWISYAVVGLPYVVIILVAALRRFDADLERAAASLGAAPLRTFRDVTLPLLGASFASAFLFAFLAGFDDLIISLFLSSPSGTTIAMRMWEDIRLEISPKTAVVGVLQLVVLLIAVLASRLFTTRAKAR